MPEDVQIGGIADVELWGKKMTDTVAGKDSAASWSWRDVKPGEVLKFSMGIGNYADMADQPNVTFKGGETTEVLRQM